MEFKFSEDFRWMDGGREAATEQERYGQIVRWAGDARGRNPAVFDELTAWLLDDAEWSEDKLRGNEMILMRGVLARFREQNARLRGELTALAPSGVVNDAVFAALDRFDTELSGKTALPQAREAVRSMFADFSCMRSRAVREWVAGDETGPSGTHVVKRFGYVNELKDCDAAVQWALFMPEVVKRQQNGFKLASFEYKRLPAMRLIGFEGEEYEEAGARDGKMAPLRARGDGVREIDADLLFMHFDGAGVDVGRWRGVWGRFFKADAPVPEGYIAIDFTPERVGHAGPPYISQFAYAAFSGDPDAMHKREGYDDCAMYDVTRNIILGEGVAIPYPDKYWTAEAFPEGCDKPGTAYLFCAELSAKGTP